MITHTCTDARTHTHTLPLSDTETNNCTSAQIGVKKMSLKFCFKSCKALCFSEGWWLWVPDSGSKNRERSLSKGLKREARNWQQWGVKKAQCPRSEGQYGHQHWLYMLKGTGSEKVHCYGVYFVWYFERLRCKSKNQYQSSTPIWSRVIKKTNRNTKESTFCSAFFFSRRMYKEECLVHISKTVIND